MGNNQTFLVHIIENQNATWQGDVTWLDQEKKESFRSLLELGLLPPGFRALQLEAELLLRVRILIPVYFAYEHEQRPGIYPGLVV